MNKNILLSVQKDYILSILKVVEIKNRYDNIIKKIIADELNDDIIYKNLILKNRNLLSYFIEGYLSYIDERDKNNIFNNINNDIIKKLFLEHYGSILDTMDEIIDSEPYTTYPKFFNNIILVKFQDDILKLINNIDIKLIKEIFDNYINGSIKITINTLYEKINDY